MCTCASQMILASLRPMGLPPRGLSRFRRSTVRMSKTSASIAHDADAFVPNTQALSRRICFTARRRQVPTGLESVKDHRADLICGGKSAFHGAAETSTGWSEIIQQNWMRENMGKDLDQHTSHCTKFHHLFSFTVVVRKSFLFSVSYERRHL